MGSIKMSSFKVETVLGRTHLILSITIDLGTSGTSRAALPSEIRNS
jgi:hypothetical protein